MSDEMVENNFEYFQKSILADICAQYVEMTPGATPDSFVRDLFFPMFQGKIGGDKVVSYCIEKHSMYRDDLIRIACGYLVQAIEAKAIGGEYIAWTYLMDAQHNVCAASYAGRLRANMPEMEAEAALDAVRSSKSKGGQKTNEFGRIIGDKAVELIKARGSQGRTWTRVRDAVREIKPELWQFMHDEDPDRSEENYERSVVNRLNKRINEVAQFIGDASHRDIRK